MKNKVNFSMKNENGDVLLLTFETALDLEEIFPDPSGVTSIDATLVEAEIIPSGKDYLEPHNRSPYG